VEPSNSWPSIVVPSNRRLAGTGGLEVGALVPVPADGVGVLAVPAGAGVDPSLLGTTAGVDGADAR
jgi:hypothetical protein